MNLYLFHVIDVSGDFPLHFFKIKTTIIISPVENMKTTPTIRPMIVVLLSLPDTVNTAKLDKYTKNLILT